ncbi:MAG: hypothetical protein A6F71_09720 [Cycloclasticus sp. symbiont of Poecilosclerida sp. M]|nr:MAG: hypothetical protein A6F71_09720 [Cycloclasticus sp. symbiont of Poecilosclerida sp. M]
MTMLQHCDKVIPLEYPDKAKEKTFFNQVIITSDQVDLVMEKTKSWTVFMDRSKVSVCAVVAYNINFIVVVL